MRLVTSPEATIAKEFIVETDITMSQGDKDDYCGIMFSYSPYAYQNFIRFYPESQVAVINSREWMGEMDIDLSSVYRSAGALLLPTSCTCIKNNFQTNRLRLVVNGKYLKAYINDVIIADTYDDALPDLQRLAGEEGGKIYLLAHKAHFSDFTNYHFRNFKLYRGVNAVLFAPEFLKESSPLAEQVDKLQCEGFVLTDTNYYSTLDNHFLSTIKTSLDNNPVLLNVICDSTDKDKIAGLIPEEYTGEVVYTLMTAVNLKVSNPVSDKLSYQPGESIHLKTPIQNTGLTDISGGLVKYQITDANGTVISRAERVLNAVPTGSSRDLDIIIDLPLTCADGQYNAGVNLEAYSNIRDRKYTVSEQTQAAFQISGLSRQLLAGIGIVLAIVIISLFGILIYVIKRKSLKGN